MSRLLSNEDYAALRACLSELASVRDELEGILERTADEAGPQVMEGGQGIAEHSA